MKKTIHLLLILEHIKMNTMSYYHDLRLKTDILLLLDLFQTFIDTYLKYYGLDRPLLLF